MSVQEADFLVIGGGIAGASAAYNLAGSAKVVVLERESQPGYHSTGRSAALYSETYGNFIIRALTVASGAFYDAPPAGFADHDLLTPRGTIIVGREDQVAKLDQAYAEARQLVDNVARLDRAEVLERCPLLRPDYVAGGVLEPDARDIDVHAVHGGFLRGLRARGGSVVTDAEVLGLRRDGGKWTVETRAGSFAAPVVINAAGAWCDEIAALAGVTPVGLEPKRRTAFTFAAPADTDLHALPMIIDADESFYFKPEVGQFLASPADETPIAPCDVQPEEIDIAEAVERIETCSTLQIRRINHKWAGLRSFVADRTPVVGFDAAAEGFFWLAGQGGYGIQTSPAMGQLAAALARSEDVPAPIAAFGVKAEALSPLRFARIAAA